MVDQLNNKEPKVKITYGDGTTEIITVDEASERGIKNIDPKNGSEFYSYDDENGKKLFSTKATDLPSSITLDEKTGNIKITAPKAVTDLDEFKRTFNEDELKAYSLAYKLNPDYKVKTKRYNRDTGESEEVELTIPEWVSDKNESIKLFMEDLAVAYDTRDRLVKEYGDKASNMTPTQIMMTYQYDKYTYIPKAILNASNFGPNGKNPFKKLGSRIDSDGKISVKDLKEAYSRNELGREELAGMMATLDGALKGGEWGDEYYTDENGNKVYNVASATEAAKMLAFRNFLQSHHPDGNWWQEMGGNIEQLSIDAMYGMTRVVTNIANDVEGFFSNGSSKNVQNYIKDMDTTMEKFHENRSLETDSAQVLATLGMIGGSLAAGWAVGKVAGGAIGLAGKGIGAIGGVLMKGAPTLGVAASAALTEETIAGIAANPLNYTKGAWIALKFANAAEKAVIAKNVCKTFMEAHTTLNFVTEFLLDTIHDALLYDSTTLRDALESADNDVKDYWLGQLADNAKWWGAMSFAKGSVKFAGKTALGKALNIRTTKLISRIAANIGNKKAKFRDTIAGGDVVRKLESKIDEAREKGNVKTMNRLKRKLEQERWNANLRKAREQLGKLDLEWRGLKLTDESADQYRNLTTRIRALEVGIDRYNRNIEYQRQLMVGAQYDPSTGKVTFINPSLGKANLNATEYYFKLADLAKKYNLPIVKGSFLSQDMIDYMVGKYYEGLATSFAKGTTEKAAKAQAALPIIQANLEDAASRLPEEIINAIDDGVRKKIYQTYYLEQNEYGAAKGILNRAKIESYYSNEIWKENGYMPLAVLMEESTGHFVDKEGRIAAKIEEEFEDLQFDVARGQHYEDPELVRQSRLSDMAQMEVNSQLFKTYAGFGSDATNVTKISGEETEYARVLKESRAYLDKAVEDSAKSIGENLDATINKTLRRKPIKNKTVPESDRVTIVASMSPEDIRGFLQRRKGVLAEDGSISNNVTAENYPEWYKSQSSSVKKWLKQQKNNYYADFTIDERGVKVKRVNMDGREVEMDYEIADRIKAMNDDGYITFNSHSGISADHDDPSDAGDGYIQFYGYLDKERADKVKAAAAKAGMGVEERPNFYYGKTLVVRQSNAADGTSYDDIVQEANRKTYDKFDVPAGDIEAGEGWSWLMDNKKDSAAWDFREKEIKKLYKKHGGYAQPDDASRTKSWDTFFDELGYKKPKEVGPDFEQFKFMKETAGQDFEDGLQRATLVGDKDFAKSPLMNEARHNLDKGREAFYQGILVANIKGKLRNIKRVDSTAFVDSLITEYERLLDSYTIMVLDDEGAMKAIKTLSETTDASADFAKYIALRKLREDGLDKAYKTIDDNIDKRLKEIKDVSTEDAANLKKQAHALFEDMLDNEIDDLSMTVRTTNPDLIDTKNIYKKADELNAKIRGEESLIKGKKAENMVMYLDDEGRQVFAEVDPAFASLYNYRYRMDRAEASALAKMNMVTSRLFRWGTTSVNLKAFGNQLFRDFGNALLIGGSWDTIKNYRKNLVDVFGDNIVDQIGRFDPTGYEMKQLRQVAEANGQTLQEAAVSRELMRGAAISPTTTERTLYKEFMKDAYDGDSEVRLQKMQTKFQKFVDKWNPEDLLNGKRENYLRNRVYAHSLNDAMKNGYDLEQSRVFAEFAMNNATTNFSRQLYHLQAIADSTPYFRAAINGTKSFWRMWAMDPVGVSGRITGGLILPVMFLTGASLGDEENRKIYENIPEYQKQDSFIFVINGEIISAPMPQELSAIAAPFRQFVEYLHDTNKNDFWELMMNDALGFFPYELQGFSTIDMDAMIQDPTVFDRISRGVSRVFSQMAPIPLKTAYMVATGTDPYSGKNLRNPAYSYWNDETNSVETLDYNQNSFAKWFAELPFVKSWMTPDLAEKVVSGVVGTTGSNLLGDITALFANGGGAMMEETMRHAGESISAPFTVPQYDLTDAIWKRAVKEMTAEKEAILQSDEMKTLNKELSQEKDPDKRKDLLAERQNLVNDYQNKVGDMVQRLESKYQGTFDAGKFAAVIQLLNFNTDTPYQTASQYASDLASSMYFEGRDAAISTMRDLGINGVHDTSIFGYLAEDKDGNVIMKYNNPIAIMDMANTWSNQNDYHLANIKALINQNDLWDKKDAMKAQINAIYNKDKLSDADYDAIDAIYVNWNADVMKTIAPYVSAMTPEAAINNIKVMDYLSGLIEVPGEFKKDKYGRYVTNSKLGLGSAKDAYIESYINYIYGVNDTGYEGGRNYSDRQKYDKENKRWTK